MEKWKKLHRKYLQNKFPETGSNKISIQNWLAIQIVTGGFGKGGQDGGRSADLFSDLKTLWMEKYFAISRNLLKAVD